MGKPKKPTDPAKPNPNIVTAQKRPGEALEDAMARVATSPEVQAAMTVRAYAGISKDDVTTDALIVELVRQCHAGSKGDLAQGERMLVAQAHALDTVFGHLIRRARIAETMPQLEAYTRLALKAQSQCRTTWESLAAIKNPTPLAFVRQANIAHGPQQINNGMAAPSRAGENGIQQTQLSEDGNELLPYTGTPGLAGGADPALETVGTINRAKDAGG